MRTVRLVGVVVLWLLQFLMTVAFVVIGIAKFARPVLGAELCAMGIPDGFYMVIGALEAAGGLRCWCRDSPATRQPCWASS